MIRISRYLYINILTVILFIICAFLHTLDILCITYLVMLLHEAAHAITAVCIGLRVSHISLQPFGVNLKLKNKMVYSLAEEIILYISGPLCNACVALLALFLYKFYPNPNLRFFYVSNTALFVMNMLPSSPLDGGIILKRVITRLSGYEAANKITFAVSSVFAFMAAILGIYVFVESGTNFSVLLFAFLMIGNVFTQKEKYNTDFIKELMFLPRSKKGRVHHIIVPAHEKNADIAKKFKLNRRNIVYITDESDRITDTLTDTQIINRLLSS